METFAAYGFNKSHSAAYALITYQTAYLKAHYPTEFMAGLLSLEAGDIDNTYKNIAECRERGIPILPPDVNESRDDFTAAGETIRFGLGAVKGVGAKAIEAIIAAREDGRVHEPARLLPARAQPAREPARDREPVKCGAFDSVERNRARLLARARRRHALGGEPRRGALDHQIGLFAPRGGRPTRRRRCRRPPRGTRRRSSAPSARRSASSSPATRSTATRRTSGKLHQRHHGTLRTRGAELPPADGERNGRPDTRPRVRLGGVIHTLKLQATARRATATRPSSSRTRRAWSR